MQLNDQITVKNFNKTLRVEIRSNKLFVARKTWYKYVEPTEGSSLTEGK